MEAFDWMFYPEKSLNAYTTISKPEKSYAKSGNLTLTTDKCLRLHFNVFNAASTRFDIQCYEEQPASTETILLTIGSSGKKIYLNLNECNERLHLSKDKLLAFHKKGLFSEFLDKKSQKLKLLDKINDHYDKVINHYDEALNPDYLVSKQNTNAPLIPKNGLMKIIRLFHKVLQSKPLPVHFFMTLSEKVVVNYGLNSMSKILTSASASGDYYLINESSKKRLINGQFGIIYKVYNITLGIFSVIKESIIDDSDESYQDVVNEISNLKKLQGLGLTKAIQKPPYFSFETNKNDKQISYAGFYYNRGDLFEFIKLIKFDDKLKLLSNGFTDLIYALHGLHELKFFHNDIKPENIFVEIDNDGKCHLCFGDMGGLRQAKNYQQKFKIGMHTPCFTPISLSFRRLSVKELQALDVYQLGACIIITLTNTIPFQTNPDSTEYPNLKLKFDDVKLLQICSNEAVFMLKRMCHPEWKLRFTIKDALDCIKNPGFTWAKLNM